MSGISLQINVPVQLGILDFMDIVTVSNTLVQEVDHTIETVVSDYTAFKNGEIINDMATKMTTFTESVISKEVSQDIRIKPGSVITSVKIQIYKDENSNVIIDAVKSALQNLPLFQQDIVQIVITFVLSTQTMIETDDYTYDKKMRWTLAINYKRNLAL
jgi:predicted naringenin-chalcone synthase